MLTIRGLVFRVFLAGVLSIGVMASFLGHYSLLDGAPRNSLQLFFDQQADRPFAYRLLAPLLVRGIDRILPNEVRHSLADQMAPRFKAAYVAPLLPVYEPLLPGISERAERDWQREDYRVRYLLMVMLMGIACFGALLLAAHTACLLGASPQAAVGTLLLYALVLPTMFLNGGYFYDFIEQFAAFALIYCIVKNRWFIAATVLLLMQLNKETALLMPLFLLPLIYARQPQHFRQRLLFWVLPMLLVTLGLYFLVRHSYAGNPGQVMEWHLPGNLSFWTTPANWWQTADFYGIGIKLPRCSFLLFSVGSLLVACFNHRNIRVGTPGNSALLQSASFSLLVLGSLLLTMGFQDEYRNLSLALPLLILLVASGSSTES